MDRRGTGAPDTAIRATMNGQRIGGEAPPDEEPPIGKRISVSEEFDGECPKGAAGPNHIPQCLLSEEHHTVVELDRVCRVALMVTPHPTGDVIDQTWEAVSTIRAVMKQQQVPMTVTMQTVYVRSADDIRAIRRLMEAYYGDRTPTTSFIVQPPCDGQALAIEAWALGDQLHCAAPV